MIMNKHNTLNTTPSKHPYILSKPEKKWDMLQLREEDLMVQRRTLEKKLILDICCNYKTVSLFGLT